MIWCVLLAYIPYAGSTDTIRLNMQAYLTDYPQDADGKWIHTMSGDYLSLDFEDFRFTHLTNAMQAQGTDENGMQYWDGFTICTNGDDTDYGFAGSSTSWPEHQWGCMAGGGIDSLGKLVKGAPYLVAYWGYNYEEEGVHSLQVDFNDGETHRPIGIWVCNHPWAYYGIQHDDGFAHSFADNGAQFNLVIHGLDEEAKEAGMPIVHHLAHFHNDDLDISTEWQWVDISSLGQVNAIYFTMESTDVSGVLGINPEIYEAAEIDGANDRQIFFRITIPNLRTILTYTLVTSLIGGLSMYDIPKMLNNGNPNNSTLTATMFIYNQSFQGSYMYARGAAASMILFLIIAALSAVVFFLMRDRK